MQVKIKRRHLHDLHFQLQSSPRGCLNLQRNLHGLKIGRVVAWETGASISFWDHYIQSKYLFSLFRGLVLGVLNFMKLFGQ